jgi:Domain of unknown function (DUF1707)/Cell wall-active antibiotics response 4TMS YvqF
VSETPPVRASDAERERAVAKLRDHAVAGRLTLEEFAERSERALAVRTSAELHELTRDLPQELPPPPKKGRRWYVALIGGVERRGHWRVPERMTIVGLIGGAELDLTQAELEAPETTIDAGWVIGGVELVVPAGIEVEVGGVTVIGGAEDEGAGQLLPGAPRIRVRQFGLIGGLEIKRRR